MNSTYWLNKVMDTVYTSSSNQFWVGLSSSEPLADGTGFTEPVGGNYKRVMIEGFTEPVDGMVKNVSDIMFAQSTATWFESTAKATYWLIFDSANGGNLLSSGLLDEPKTIESNTTITITKESLSITLSDYISA